MSVQVFKGDRFTVYKFPDGTDLCFHEASLVEKIPNPDKIEWRMGKPGVELFSLLSGVHSVNINGVQYVVTNRDLCFNVPTIDLSREILKKVGISRWWPGSSAEAAREKFNQIVALIGDITPRIFLLQDGSLVLAIGDKFAQYFTNNPNLYDHEEEFVDLDDAENQETKDFIAARRSGAFSWYADEKAEFSETLFSQIQGQIVREVDVSEIKQGIFVKMFDMMYIETRIRPRADVAYVSGLCSGPVRKNDYDIITMLGPEYVFEVDFDEPGYVTVFDTSEFLGRNLKFTPDPDAQEIIAEQAMDVEWLRCFRYDTLILQLSCMILRQRCQQAGIPYYDLSIYGPEKDI